ncbi:MAG: 50S ribosomal protein L18e [Candidatus Bathyarchaeota archaeon]
MKTKVANLERLRVIRLLHKKSREEQVNIWKKMSDYLKKAKRRRLAVNISQISRYSEDNDTVIVPGKVLSAGIIKHPVTVAAFSFSEKAKEKIQSTNGKCLNIEELMMQNPKGSKIKIIR